MMIPFIIGLPTVVIVVLIHYEVLHLLNGLVGKPGFRYRRSLITIILCAILAHILEIFIFALGFYLPTLFSGIHSIQGDITGSFRDYVYFAGATYTTLGYGDIVPTPEFRVLASLISISGLTLITWTASFTYLQMVKLWK